MPEGLRMLPEEERESLLCSLVRSKRDAEAALQALPFNLETHSQVSGVYGVVANEIITLHQTAYCTRIYVGSLMHCIDVHGH